MTPLDPVFEPTMAAAHRRLQAIRPEAYAATRHHLAGAVTGLSPYLTHGLLDLPGVIAHLRDMHGLDARHRLVFELGWRAYFRHVWQHDGDAILRSRHAGPLPDEAYGPVLPADVREARTGLPVIDLAVRALYETGWLHNAARLWLASALVHGRKIHWRIAADWLYGHLVDGDLGSNHLSWQWVAGTASHKPYLFDAQTVRHCAPAEWHVDGSEFDADRAALLAMAQDASVRRPEGAADGGGVFAPGGMAEPPLLSLPPEGGFARPDPREVAGQDVWLVHPWSLGDVPAGRLAVAVCDADFHARWPWSERRWRFVARRMAVLAGIRWLDRGPALVAALQAARSVRGLADPHLGTAFRPLRLAPPAAAFSEPGRRCRSFSGWWARTRLQLPPAGDAGTPNRPDTIVA